MDISSKSDAISGQYRGSKFKFKEINSVVVALACLVILIPTKVLSKKYAKQLKNIPIPGELFIVFVTTLLFSFYQPEGYISGKLANSDCYIWFGFDFIEPLFANFRRVELDRCLWKTHQTKIHEYFSFVLIRDMR